MGKPLPKCFREKLEDNDPITHRPYNFIITDIAFEIAMSPKSSNKDKLAAIEFITKYAYGAPVATNLNADITVNPFDNIPTEKLEALKTKLLAIDTPATRV